MLLCPTRRGWTVRPKCAGISGAFASSSAPWPCIVLFGISVSLFELCLVAFSENKISNKKPDTYSVSGETEFLGGEPTERGGEFTNQNSQLSLRKPAFEFSATLLADHDSLGRFGHNIDGYATAKPHRNVAHSTARNNKLAVGAEELLGGQLCRKFVECAIYYIGTTLVGVGPHLFGTCVSSYKTALNDGGFWFYGRNTDAEKRSCCQTQT